MSLTRLFTLLGLCGVLVATALATVGHYKSALALLAAVVLAGVILAVVNWKLG